MERISVKRPEAALSCIDYGGSGPPVLLLHGLAGTALEWSATAAWLTATNRVLALDQRAHGKSTRAPADLSRDESRADAQRAETIPDAGHDVHLEQPQAWRVVVERFLAEVARGS